jgi:SAM-dependent methyltransferase
MPEVLNREDLMHLYRARFKGIAEYRGKMWDVLTAFFERWIPPDGAVLDLGCGYCEFINKVHCQQKFGMDLNPDSVRFAETATIVEQDCSQPWPLKTASLDVVFTSNFFEHLPTKGMLESTLIQAFRCLKPGGRLIAMGPNIRYLAGTYWDFFDHYLPLTEKALVEVLTKVDFEMERCHDKFMPYTAVGKRQYPMGAIRAYLALPLAWRFLGKQFLVIARRPT